MHIITSKPVIRHICHEEGDELEVAVDAVASLADEPAGFGGHRLQYGFPAVIRELLVFDALK
jgi:hypothetical protein